MMKNICLIGLIKPMPAASKVYSGMCDSITMPAASKVYSGMCDSIAMPTASNVYSQMRDSIKMPAASKVYSGMCDGVLFDPEGVEGVICLYFSTNLVSLRDIKKSEIKI